MRHVYSRFHCSIFLFSETKQRLEQVNVFSERRYFWSGGAPRMAVLPEW